MSTWISDHMARWAVLGLVFLALTACEALDENAPSLRSAAKERVIKTVTLTSADVTITAPFGFCAEPSSIDDRAAWAVAVFGNCTSIGGTAGNEQPLAEALVTASVIHLSNDEVATLSDPAALVNFLQTPGGRLVLSASGDAADIEVLDAFSTKRAAYIHVRDPAATEGGTLAARYWRSVIAVPGAAVTFTARGLEDGGLSPAQGLNLMREFARGVTATAAANAANPAVDEPKPSGQTLTTGLLGRLFG